METEQTIVALLKQKLESFEEKMDLIVEKLDNVTTQMLCKDDAAKIYTTKLEMEKVKNMQNFYALVVPILTGVIGFLINKLF